MDPAVQQLLLAKAAQEAEEGPRLSDMVALGAGGGAAVAALQLGSSQLAAAADKGRDAYMASQGFSPVKRARTAPGLRGSGLRLAGYGLLGAGLAGGLGAVMKNQMDAQGGTAGKVLADIQVNGVNENNQYQLATLLEDIYKDQGII